MRSPMPPYALLGTLLLVGCPPDSALQTLHDANPAGAPQPNIVVEALPGGDHLLDAGEVEIGDAFEGEVLVRNTGDDTLQLEALAITGGGAWSILESPAPLLIPEAEVSIRLRYAPQTDEAVDARLSIRSNDSDEPEVLVRLLAEGLAPVVAIEPAGYDFGNPEIGCTGEVEFTVANLGRAALTLTEVALDDLGDGGELLLAVGVVPGTVLQPGESVPVVVRHEPGDVAPDAATLIVASDDPWRPELTALVSGIAHPGAAHTDAFEQLGNNQTDVLFVIDNSGSMSEDQASLAANFGSFLAVVTALDVDFHLGVVTTDVGGDLGQLQGSVRVITPSTPDPQATFDANANVGGSGSGIEQGFHSAYLALSPPNVDGANAGFLREAAGLRIVFVSDEAEQSGSILGWSREDYLIWFQNLKANPEHVVLSSILDTAAQCADPADDYAWAAMTTGGVCAGLDEGAWVELLTSLGWLSQSFADTFELSAVPVPGTVSVQLNGVDLFVGWTYSPELTAVLFDDTHVPENGDLIEISYAVQGSCDD